MSNSIDHWNKVTMQMQLLVLFGGSFANAGAMVDKVTVTEEQAAKMDAETKAAANETKAGAATENSVNAINSDNIKTIDEPMKINSTVTGRSGDLPIKGIPNSSVDLINKDGVLIQRRYYDANGNAIKDIDYMHGEKPGSHVFPHDHYWDWNNNPPRSK